MASIPYIPEVSAEDSNALSLPSKLHEWIVTVDHKRLGVMYIATSLLFFSVAGILAALMRTQLAFPDGNFLPPEVFNRLFTMHGTTMVFMVGMPMVGRICELSGTTDDWRARHGVSAAKRLGLLDLSLRRISAVLQLYRRRRPVRRRFRSGCWLVCIRSSNGASLLSRGSTDYWTSASWFPGLEALPARSM